MTDTIPEHQQSLDEGTTQYEQRFDFFVYGTLCVPAVLVRVLGRKCDDLTFQDAILPGYTRHCVKGEDYPAVIDRNETNSILPPDAKMQEEEYDTRGTLVSGLRYPDVKALDVFEGSEYSRRKVTVKALSDPSTIHELPASLLDPSSRAKTTSLREGDKTRQECWTYAWSAPLDRLEPKIWSFNEFIRDKAKYWVSADTTEYDDVDRHRALETMPAVSSSGEAFQDRDDGHGEESKVSGGKMNGYPDFGHGMLKDFQFEDGYLNFNHGSYGSIPRPVAAAKQKLLSKIEANPDRFMRRDWLPLLNNVRAKTAELIGATADECVIVPNTTHGINTITQNITWQPGDRIVTFSTTYGAVQQMMRFYCDMHPEINLDIVDLTFPCSHESMVRKAEDAITKWNEPAITNYTGQPTPTGKTPDARVRIVIVDSIASNPGMVLPWERVAEVCHRYGVMSLVDGAHSIGQHKVDVGRSKCDFFVTNCHKWLYAPRSAAVMYVPTRNQHLVKSSFPVSAGYESSRYPTPGTDRKWNFEIQYEWNGTCDWSSFMSVADAVQWRKEIGGEERIMDYCHSLAVQGGKRISKKWGTRIMENKEGNLTAAMVNVALPDIPPPKSVDDMFLQLKYMERRMYEINARFVPFVHDGIWWGRFSAQIFVELDDFDRIADMTRTIMTEVRDGKYLDIEPPETDTLHRPEDVPVNDQ